MPSVLARSGRSASHNVADYSLVRALRAVEKSKGNPIAGLEGDVSAVLGETFGDAVGERSFIAPLDAFAPRQRSLPTTADVAGAIPTMVARPSDFTDLLRAKAVVGRLGGRFVTLYDGHVAAKVPTKTTAAAAGWIAPDAELTFSKPVFADDEDATPRLVAAGTTITRRVWNSTDAELHAYIIADLAGSMAAAVDAAALVGAGGLEPVGLFNEDAAVPVVELGTNGAAPTRAKLLEVMKAVHAANGDAPATASMGWAASVGAEAKLRSVDGSSAGSGDWLWSNGDRILGKPAAATTAIPDTFVKGSGSDLGGLVYGNWADLMVNAAPAVQVLVDPFALSASGSIRIVCFWDVRILIRHAASFALVNDMVV